MANVNSDLTVSLEPHLLEILTPLVPIVPHELASKLTPELSGPEIHYNILSDISKWSRTDQGKAVLVSNSLDASSYSMVNLLAGTVTAPSAKLPPYTPPESPEQSAKREMNDRKAVTAIINALLSIGGCGAATWWAADKTGWREEWKVLLALLVAAVVAVSEGILYIIWQARKSRKSALKLLRTTRQTKRDGDMDTLVGVPIEEEPKAAGLRRRPHKANKKGDNVIASIEH